MEKLIELLNEFIKINWYWWDTKYIDFDKDTECFNNWYSSLEYEIVIGRKFWFIEWLVNNDKINLYITPLEWIEDLDKYNQEDKLLMTLSISDTPIDDLISYLK